MKASGRGALALMVSLFWTLSAVAAYGSRSLLGVSDTHSPKSLESLLEVSLAHDGMNSGETGKTVIVWERREISRSYQVREKAGSDRSLRSFTGISTNDDRKGKGHALSHAEPEEDCGCTDEPANPGGSGILRSVQPQEVSY